MAPELANGQGYYALQQRQWLGRCRSLLDQCEVGMNLLKAGCRPPYTDPGLEHVHVSRRHTRVEDLQAQVDRLTKHMRIAVIFGGDKEADGAVIHRTFNPRTWKSYEKVAYDIAGALQRIGFQHVVTMPDDMRLGERLRREMIDFAWLNTAGVQGIGSAGHAPAMLEMFGVPYVGHNPLNAAMLDNKHVLKRDLVLAGIPTAPFIVWQPWRAPIEPLHDPRFLEAFGEYCGPFVVKPVSGRASHHVDIVHDVDQLQNAVEIVFDATKNNVLIEAFLPGEEYCIAICGQVICKQGRLKRLPGPFAFAAIERRLDPHEHIFTSMDHRPITIDRVRALDPEADRSIVDSLKRLAQTIYADFDVETLIRLDVRADESGNLHILEANPKPDLSAPDKDRTSLVCSGLRNEGMTYDDLILSLLADRIDILFSQRRSTVGHLEKLLS